MGRGGLGVVEGKGWAELGECVIHATTPALPLYATSPSHPKPQYIHPQSTQNILPGVRTLKFGKFFPAALSMNQCTSPFAG